VTGTRRNGTRPRTIASMRRRRSIYRPQCLSGVSEVLRAYRHAASGIGNASCWGASARVVSRFAGRGFVGAADGRPTSTSRRSSVCRVAITEVLKALLWMSCSHCGGGNGD
jgi:hypothetical protein